MAPPIPPFAVEQWFDAFEHLAKYNIAETCTAPLSINELRALSDDNSVEPISLSLKLDYGVMRGSARLRESLSRLYSTKTPSLLPAENILITPGAIQANFEVFFALVGTGDHIICAYPTYQQLYTVPESFGAEVSLWNLQEKEQFIPNVDRLRELIKPNTKLIVLTNPNNPTGAIIPKSVLKEIITVAEEHDIVIVSDEVYRPLFHSISPMDPEFPPSILSMGYPKVIATGSLSKAFALPGIRVGWIASRDMSLIEACAKVRDYTTISVSQLDDQIASYAMSPEVIHNLLARNIALAKKNLEILENFVKDHGYACSWVKPVAGSTAFIKFKQRGGVLVDDESFCRDVLEKIGVMLCPGSLCFGRDDDFKGYVRIGFVCETDVLTLALEQLSEYIQSTF